VAQTAASLELMRRFSLTKANGIGRLRAFAERPVHAVPPQRVRSDRRPRVGQESLFEDVALARRVANAAAGTGVFVADGLFHCRMYPDWLRFRSGWKRIYTQAADCDASRLADWSRQARWIGTILPGSMLRRARWARSSRCAIRARLTVLVLFRGGIAVWLGALARIGAIGGAVMGAPLHLAGAWLVANVFAEGARDVRSNTPTEWGGASTDCEWNARDGPGTPANAAQRPCLSVDLTFEATSSPRRLHRTVGKALVAAVWFPASGKVTGERKIVQKSRNPISLSTFLTFRIVVFSPKLLTKCQYH
jgi:hypothetical protein